MAMSSPARELARACQGTLQKGDMQSALADVMLAIVRDHVDVDREAAQGVVGRMRAAISRTPNPPVAAIAAISRMRSDCAWVGKVVANPACLEEWNPSSGYMEAGDLVTALLCQSELRAQQLTKNGQRCGPSASSEASVRMQCPVCPCDKAVLIEKQTRSADEPATPMAQCTNCHTQWRR